MAEAGFFFAGTEDEKDNVQCPFCLKEMYGWEPTDDPWYVVMVRILAEVCFNSDFFVLQD